VSYNVSKEWYYYLRGRELLLYKLLGGSTTERISQSGILSTRDNELMYPDEDIADGLRIEYTALNEPFVAEALETTTAYGSGTNISFALSGTRITTTTANFWDTTSGFAAGDKIRVQGSTSNDADYTIDSFGGGSNVNMVVSGSTITDESAGERITVTQIPKEVASASVDETSHANINQMLSLAIVDYVKAMKAESMGDLATKEYHIREFYSKLGDNEGNKRKIAVSFPTGPFAVR
tara:strand:- start:40 stop:747 length:708 start_codon:yes stop_codon:yes gene_type:complete